MTKAHRYFWDRGYRLLLPVVPPSATYIRNAGKRPGNRSPDGTWYGQGVQTYVATEADLDTWSDWGAGVGLRTWRDYVPIDIDSMHAPAVARIKDIAREVFGEYGAERIGQQPKSLLLYQTLDVVPYRNHRFDDSTDKGGLVEMRGGVSNSFIVVQGKHPSGSAYTWPGKVVPPRAELPYATLDQVGQFFDAVNEEYPKRAGVSAGLPVDRSKVDQEQHKIPPDRIDAIVAALKLLPNRYAETGYEWWIRLAAACRGAFADDPQLGCDVFCDISERCDVPEPTEDAERTYWSLDAPFAFGYGYLKTLIAAAPELWEEKSPGTLAALYYEPNAAEADEPAPVESIMPDPPAEPLDVYPLLSLDEIISRPPPVYLIKRHIPKVSLGFLYSRPGAGKTFLATDMGLSVADALETWQGDEITADEDSIVLYIVSEGAYGFRNRVKAWMKARDRSRPPPRFLVIERTINFMVAEDIERLLRTVKSTGRKLALVVVDTVSRAMPGADENLQKEMTLFVHACDRVKDAFGCAVLGVHHAGKSGDMRGSTVLLGAGDYVFKLERQEGRQIGNLKCEKQKDAEDGWEEPYAFTPIDIGDGQTSLVVDRAEINVGPSMELTPAVANSVLQAMQEAWDSGEPWSKAAQSKERFAVRRMVHDFGFDAAKAEELLAVWEGSGAIAVMERDAKRRRTGFKVLAMPRQDVQEAGVFD